MSYKEKIMHLIAENGTIRFNGEIAVDNIWDGNNQIDYFALYADELGIHACPEDDFENIDCYEPIGLGELDEDTLKDLYFDIDLCI